MHMTKTTSARTQGVAITPETRAPDHISGGALADALDVIDWSEAPCPGLGRAMARRDVDLATALRVFFRGAPERFNYLPKPHVPEGYRAVARHLDNICLRINSGFYLPAPGGRMGYQDSLDRWLDCQRADRQEGHRGRWVLDETVLMPLFDTTWYRVPYAEKPEQTKQSLWRTVLAPLRELRSPVFGRLRK